MSRVSRRTFIARAAGGLYAMRARAQAGFSAARAVTAGPRHHFFGYYDKSPWDATGRYLLAHEVDFVGRQPKPGEEAVIGCVDLAAGNRFRQIARTSAWCWQLGALLRWLPSDPERTVIYNVRREGAWGAEIADVRLGTKRSLSFPIYNVSPTGTLAVSLNFSRLAWTRPGYGYEGIPDPGRHVPAPEADGVYRVDLGTGEHRLVVSLAALARYKPKPVFGESYHWVNHLLFNTDGSRFILLHRWSRPGHGRGTRLFTAGPEGDRLRLLLDHEMVSHFFWRDRETILAWARHPSGGDRYYLVNEQTGRVDVIGKEVLKQDGHVSYSPDRRWILTDTYPDQRRMRTLLLYRVSDGKRIDLGRFFSPPELSGPARCDLHPRWNRDGTQVCIDSAHEQTRQVYVIDVSRYTW